jgi:hypothetical protein
LEPERHVPPVDSTWRAVAAMLAPFLDEPPSVSPRKPLVGENVGENVLNLHTVLAISRQKILLNGMSG